MNASAPNDQVTFGQLLLQCLAALLIGLFLFAFFLMLLTGIYQAWYAGRILPGIAIRDVNLGGLTRAQAAQYLLENAPLSSTDTVTLWYAENPIDVSLGQLGIEMDLAATVNAAYDFGRRGSISSWFALQLGANFTKRNIPLTITFNQDATLVTLKQIAGLYDRPVQEAGLTMDGVYVKSELGQNGRQLDLVDSLEQINLQIEQLNLEQIVLPVIETPPQIMDASPFANMAQEIINQSVSLTMPARQPDAGREWRMEPEELAPMLSFETRQMDGQTKLVPQLKQDFLNAYLQEIAQAVDVKTENPRFIFNDETGTLELLSPGVSGRALDYNATTEALQAALAVGDASTDIVMISHEPEISDEVDGAGLGVTELVHSETSYFYGSSPERIQNIETAAAQFHGLLIAPNATFSMAEAMDEISIDNGYTEALIIYNGQTIEGVGGGVCQVSTTLFRAAFFAGFPITERHPHAYRVSYYEKTSGNKRNNDLAGLDATVYVPIIDLKFVNDSPYWLLMETYVNRSASSITWKFYSTWDGRTVEWLTSGPTNIQEPEKPLYKENPELTAGEIEQVEWEADGADVRVDRSVFIGGDLLFEDTFTTQYEPWRAVYEYGPGTEGMPPADQDEE